MDDLMINLKMGSKSMEREAKKCEKEMKSYRLKVKKALEEQNTQIAQVHAETAIRKKNEQLNYLRMASRLDAVSSRLKTASTMQATAKNMGGVVKGLDQAMRTMDLEKIQRVMDDFEKQSGDLDVLTGTMDESMASASTGLTPANQVLDLISQVAAENGLEVTGMMNDPSRAAMQTSNNLSAQENDDLQRRLANLRS